MDDEMTRGSSGVTCSLYLYTGVSWSGWDVGDPVKTLNTCDRYRVVLRFQISINYNIKYENRHVGRAMFPRTSVVATPW